MHWELITNVILVASLATLAVFALLGLGQWINRKTLKKVDKPLLWMILPLALMVATYFIFDKFLIWNTRPDGSGDPSFPSSHVMVVATIFFLAAIILPRYIRSKTACALLDILMFALVALTAAGRVLANLHWLSDVLGALAFAVIFALIYYLIIRRTKHA